MSEDRARLLIPAFFLILLFAAGFASGQRGIPVEDGGEFLTVARLGGVNHPPGLPLLSLFSRASWAVFGRDCLRILFALFAAPALLLLSRRRSITAAMFTAGVLLLPAVSGRLLMWDAYSPLFLVFAATLARRPPVSIEGGYLTGLAMAVHPQGILLPVLCDWREVSPLKFLGGLFLGLSLYLALPLHSAAGAVVDWGSTGNLGNFLRQVTARGYTEVYGASMGTFSSAVLARHLGVIWEILWPVLLLPAAFGAMLMFRRDRRLMLSLEVLLAADLLFVLFVNPMAAGTTQTAVLSLFALAAFAFRGVRHLEEWSPRAGIAVALAGLVAGVLLWEPLEDQERAVEEYFSAAPLESAFFLGDNDLLYGGWVMKYVDDRRPDIVLLSTGNFSGWFERMANRFNPDIDLSKGALDVGDFSMGREELSILLMNATVRDNPRREFFSDM